MNTTLNGLPIDEIELTAAQLTYRVGSVELRCTAKYQGKPIRNSLIPENHDTSSELLIQFSPLNDADANNSILFSTSEPYLHHQYFGGEYGTSEDDCLSSREGYDEWVMELHKQLETEFFKNSEKDIKGVSTIQGINNLEFLGFINPENPTLIDELPDKDEITEGDEDWEIQMFEAGLLIDAVHANTSCFSCLEKYGIKLTNKEGKVLDFNTPIELDLCGDS